MAFCPTKPIPISKVLNLATFLQNYNSDKKPDLLDLLLATLSNEPLKKAVKSLNWKIFGIQVVCLKDIRLLIDLDYFSHVEIVLLLPSKRSKGTINWAHTAEIDFVRSYYYNSCGPRNRGTHPQPIVSDKEEIETYMRKPPNRRKFQIPVITIRKFLDHFMEIFHVPKIDMVFRSMRYDINSLKEMLSGINVTLLDWNTDIEDNDKYYLSALRTFLPTSNLRTSWSEKSKEISSDVLMPNFDALVFLSPVAWTLNNLVRINSKHVYLKFQAPAEQLLNGFIKRWQEGSNPNLRVLEILVPNSKVPWNGNVLFDGMQCEAHPGNFVPKHQVQSQLVPWEGCQRLINVYSNSGKVSTIQLRNGLFNHFAMFVNQPTFTDKNGVEREYLEIGGMRCLLQETNYVWYSL